MKRAKTEKGFTKTTLRKGNEKLSILKVCG